MLIHLQSCPVLCNPISSATQSCPTLSTPWTAAHQASLSITSSQSLPKFMSIESVLPSNHLILCHPLLLPSIFPSITVFSNESALCIRWPKVLEFHLQHQSFQWTLRTDLLQNGLVGSLAVQGTLKSLLQHHSSKASVLRHSAFFIVQLSHPYMTTGKTIGLTRRTFVGKVMSLLFNMLSRLVITFLPGSKCLLISWLPLFIIARTWKQPRCPSADKRIRKLWYIYTMEYYSAIKKITF